MQLQLGTLGAWGGGRSGRDFSRMEGGTIVGTGDFVLEEDSGDGFHVSSRRAGAGAELCGIWGQGRSLPQRGSWWLWSTRPGPWQARPLCDGGGPPVVG